MFDKYSENVAYMQQL